MRLNGFSRNQRLLNAGDYQRVFNGKTVRASVPELLFLSIPTKNSQTRIGFILSKKTVKHAVKRNLIKRIAREQFRTYYHQYKHKDIVVLSRKGADKLDRKAIHAICRKMFKKLDERILNPQSNQRPSKANNRNQRSSGSPKANQTKKGSNASNQKKTQGSKHREKLKNTAINQS